MLPLSIALHGPDTDDYQCASTRLQRWAVFRPCTTLTYFRNASFDGLLFVTSAFNENCKLTQTQVHVMVRCRSFYVNAWPTVKGQLVVISFCSTHWCSHTIVDHILRNVLRWPASAQNSNNLITICQNSWNLTKITCWTYHFAVIDIHALLPWRVSTIVP